MPSFAEVENGVFRAFGVEQRDSLELNYKGSTCPLPIWRPASYPEVPCERCSAYGSKCSKS